MTYLMSDIHGCYEKYLKMLEMIDFSEDDELYILGDVIDRGDGSLDLLRDVMHRPNVHLILGNHEDMALSQFIYELEPERIMNPLAIQDIFSSWILHNGGLTTYEAFMKGTADEQREILDFIQKLPLFAELTVNGQHYFLSHSVPEIDELGMDPACMRTMERLDYLWGEPDYDMTYFEETILVTGHTPTGLIDPDHANRIYRKNNHIALDCGAVFGGRLGCFCVETGEEFYSA